MSAATPEWPAWLGPPGRFFAYLTIAIALAAMLFVGVWNAFRYPVPLGYDAQPNAAYMHVLLDQHHIPRPDQSGESNQPPAYYFFAEIAARAGHEIFGWLEARPYHELPEASYRGAQIFNVVLVFLTALCVLWLARIVAPDRPWVWAASVGFFAFLPVVSKTEAMIHPENLNLLCAAVAVASSTTILVRKRMSKPLVACLAASLALGIATRASAVFVLLAIVGGFAVAVGPRLLHRGWWWRRLTIAGLVLALALSAVVGLSKVHGNRVDRNASAARFFQVYAPGVFTHPWRPHFVNEALPTTYADLWGDWFGAFSWSVYNGSPSPAAQTLLKDQSSIGLLPTALAVAGWIGLCWLAFRRGRRELAIVALLPLVATAGYLIRSRLGLTADGDLFKATYVLNTAPVWALCFGVATAWLSRRSRLARYGMIALFAVFAVLELRFTLYGIRDGHPIL